MTRQKPDDTPRGRYLAALSLAALGVVFGDIGTSPLYAFRESFHVLYGMAVTTANVLGILSLIFWSLILVISIKYLIFILNADLKGEGGILVLTALITPPGETSKTRGLLILTGLFGAALLYGDSTITPAITVLSAIEGLKVATPFFQPYIIPVTIGILVALFFFQSYGTARIGKVFGSVTLIWFSLLAVTGFMQVIQAPEVFLALNPAYGIDFFIRNGTTGFLVLGSVFLVVTGGEALYADIGHFGTRPIRLAWFCFVLPSLLLNYFGQGALLISKPEAVDNPFFRMTPEWALYPVVVVATAAAIIASQAVITGAFSLTRQAIQFGYLPRVQIRHTSSREIGQIYIPFINWALMLTTIGLVLGFQSSSNLAAAYGMAVTTTMVITTILFSVVMRKKWQWSLWVVIALSTGFLIVDLSFFTANLPKIPDGGWFPLVLTAIIFTLMTTWKRGRSLLAKRLQAGELPLESFLNDLNLNGLARVEGTAIYMYSNPEMTPIALLHNLKHNKVLHKQVVVLSVKTMEEPFVSDEDRLTVEKLKDGFYRIIVSYGFSETPHLPSALEQVDKPDLNLDMLQTTFFLGRERILATKDRGMPRWRDKLFAMMTRNSLKATTYFGLPPNRVVELGAQVEL